MENLEKSKSFRFVEVDVMKGIAIILVVLGHVLAWFYDDFLERFDTMPYNAIVLWKYIYNASFYVCFRFCCIQSF